jgi:hypothetical protein
MKSENENENELDEVLLRALGRVAAEEERLSPDDQELELMCAGHLPEDRVRVLEARAAGDPELARRLEAYRPVDTASRARLTAALVREVVGAASGGFAPAEGDTAHGRELPIRKKLRARLLSARSFGSAMVVAAAAAAVLWISHRARSTDHAVPLPAYALDVVGGLRELRGIDAPNAGPIRLLPDSPLQLVMRPASATRERIAVESFLVRDRDRGTAPSGGDDAMIERLIIPFEISPDGAARARGTATTLFGARRGHWRLVLVVGKVTDGRGGGAQRAHGNDDADARRAAVDLWLLDAR